VKPLRLVLLGLGGLGCPAALALAEEARASGVALQLVLVDDDRVERGNLARQILFREEDVGRLKAEAAAEALRERFPGPLLELQPRPLRFDAATAPLLLAQATVLLDGTDSFETRFLANDLARAAALPLVHGAVLGWVGHLLTVVPGKGGCLRCLFEGPPPPGTVPACAEAGVVSPLCGLIGAAMAGEAMLLLRGIPPLAPSRLLRWNGLSGTVRATAVPRDLSCTACAAAEPAASIPHEPRRSP
jgi:molybdopterin-synthase adenylyltransferase